MSTSPVLSQIGMGADKLVFEDASGGDSRVVFIRERTRGALRGEIERMEQIATRAFRTQLPIDRLAVSFEVDRRFDVLTLRSPRAERDLERHIASGLSLSDRFQLIEDEIESIRQLHDLDLEHGDIKPENFLTFRDLASGRVIAKLADWGKTKESKVASHHVGNRRFAAPEGYGSKKGEVYSTALVMIRTLEESLDENFVLTHTSTSGKTCGRTFRGIEAFRVENGITAGVLDRVTDVFKLAFRSKGKEQRLIHSYIQALTINLYTKIIAANPAADVSFVSGTLRDLGILLKEMTLDDLTQRPTITEVEQRYAAIKADFDRISTPALTEKSPPSPVSSADASSGDDSIVSRTSLP